MRKNELEGNVGKVRRISLSILYVWLNYIRENFFRNEL